MSSLRAVRTLHGWQGRRLAYIYGAPKGLRGYIGMTEKKMETANYGLGLRGESNGKDNGT